MGKISAYYAVPHPPIIVPAVGKGEEVAIKDTAEAFDKVAAEIESIEPDVIILIIVFLSAPIDFIMPISLVRSKV